MAGGGSSQRRVEGRRGPGTVVARRLAGEAAAAEVAVALVTCWLWRAASRAGGVMQLCQRVCLESN